MFYFSCLVVFPSQKIIDRINQIELKMVLSGKKKWLLSKGMGYLHEF